MAFDEQQSEAIATTGTSILVSASAGAGKTGVLVARLLKRCTEDHVPLSRILALTFTSAAAAEMKKRLAAGLHEKAQKETDPEQNAYLNQQLVELENASITTIDSYCLSIIRKYYSVIGLDPATAANILSEGTKTSMEQEAWTSALKEYDHAHHEELLTMLKAFSPRSEDYEELHGIVNTLCAHADSSIDPDEWFHHAAMSYTPVTKFQDFPEGILDFFFDQWKQDCLSIQDDLNVMSRTALDSEKVKPELIDEKRNALEACMQELDHRNYSGFCLRLDELAARKTTADKKAEKYTAARDHMEATLKEMISLRYDEKTFIQDAAQMDPICHSLCELAELSHQKFAEIKRDHACMDFSDMERFALNILEANDGAAASAIRDSLDEIMIDEFQDTSELQNLILEKIAKPDNVFRVGDVKQSIYRFRQAKPELMRGLMEKPEIRRITLRHNYRSKDSIVRFTNLLFERLMNVPGLKDRYAEEDHVTIGRSAQEEPAPVPVVFEEILSPEVMEGEETPGSKELKASWIAGKILEMKQKDPSLKFRNFAVLVRSHGDKRYLRSVFDQAGIPYDIDAREGFFQSELCQTILAMCRLMCDPSDSVSLAAVCTSSFYAMEDEELARMKIGHPSFTEGVKALHPEILEESQELREIARQSGISAMLDEIALRHDFFERLPDSQKANFDYLSEQTAAQQPQSLRDFIDLMEASQEEKSSEAMSHGSDDDVVLVTTIHQSKGLQYRIVFLWSTSQNLFRDKSSPVLADDSLYLGMKYRVPFWNAERPTIQEIAISHKGDLEDLEEFTRLLYVALTRAEERLFIVDVVKKTIDPEPITASVLARRHGMTGLILSALGESELFHIEQTVPEKIKPAHSSGSAYAERLPSYQGDFPEEKVWITPSSREVSGLPDLEEEDHVRGRSFGTEVHEVIEQLPDRIWTMEDLKDTGLDEDACRMVLAFGNSALYQKALTMEIHKEYPFYIERDKFCLHGTMDFIAISDADVILIDFKTDRISDAALKDRYQEQIDAYRSALEILYPEKRITAYLWSLPQKHEVEIV